MGNDPAQATIPLEVMRLSKSYPQRGGMLFRRRLRVTALAEVSLTLAAQQTLGIVGASGAGKSTLARCLACLEAPDSGEIRLHGQDLVQLRGGQLRDARRQVQLILQGAAAALNPRFSAMEAVTEPLLIAGGTSKRERRERGLHLMESVGLPRDAADRGCMQFSGGQRQRLSIARALSLHPRVLILDESLSGLDLPVQAQIVNLLFDLQERESISYVFISHDLRLAAHVADHLAVMQGGRIVEQGAVDRVARHPQHAHTRELLSAVLRLPRDR
jgi:peptide/nickel transport system ATP-binding protein